MGNYTLTDYLLSPDEDGKIIHSEEKEVLKILRQTGKELISTKRDNVYVQTHIQLLSILSLADFSGSIEETQAVAGMIEQSYEAKNMPPYLIDIVGNMTDEVPNYHEAYDIGSRMLCSLGMFYECLRERRTPIKMFRNLGKEMIRYTGYWSVSNHFEEWENFMREYLPGVLDSN